MYKLEKIKKWLFVLLLGLTLSSISAFSQIVINEFVADNDQGLLDPDYLEYGDWIELYNTSNQPVSLNGLYLSDDPLNLFKWSLPGSNQLPAKGYLIIWADNKNAGVHTNFRLNYAGEFLAISSAMGFVMDSLTFGLQVQGASYGRQTDGGDHWVIFSTPSPGAANNTQVGSLISSPPHFSHRRGFFTNPINLELTAPGGGEIRYTLDGSDPAISSPLYAAAIQINKTTVVRARVYNGNQSPSPIVTETLLVNEITTLPIFSITTDPKNLWDLDTGIYVEGRNYSWGWGNGNFWQDWEKEAFIEFFEQDRSVKIAQTAGLKITGALSRTASQKSLRLIARRSYGEPKFDYRFFKNKNINQFNEIKLRSAGNDWASTMMKDGSLQTIIAGQMDIDYQSYRPSIVYLNGEYWGIHNIREMIGDDYIEENHGFDKNNLDFITQTGTVKEGDSKAYTDLLTFVTTKDMTNADNYATAAEKIDVQEYINYNVAEIFYANIDWPAGNIKYWRPRIPGGIWRWIIFDQDLAFDYVWHNTLEWATLEDPPDYPGSTDLFKSFMKSPEFSDRFLSTMLAHLNSTFDADRMIGVIDSLQRNIAGEMALRHIQRWIGHHGWTFMDPVLGYIETPWLASYDDWLTNVDKLRYFASNRKPYILGFLKSFYGLEDPVEIDLKVSPAGSGRILLDHSLVVSNKEDATYFTDQELNLTAIPEPQYSLDQWEIRSNTLQAGQSIPIIPALSNWKYYDTGSNPPSDWKSPDYTDNWPEGCGMLGYNNEGLCSSVSFGPDANNKYITTFFRKKFRIKEADQWSRLTINLVRDDGAIVYLNGTEVVRSNMPNVADYSTLASTGTDGANETTYFPFDIPAYLLRDGINVIAVEVHQVSPSSSDLVFDLSLTGVVGQSNVETLFYSAGDINQSFQWQSEVIAHFVFNENVPDLSINEVMTSNISTYSDRLGTYSDWIEIYNPGNSDVNLGGLYITDNLDNPGKWQIPSNQPDLTTVPSKGFCVLFADGRTTLGANHLDFKVTGNGEVLGLAVKTEAGFNWIDTLSVPPLFPDVSFGRFPDGGLEWKAFTINPSPGSENKEDNQVINEVVKLYQPYPNPFSEETYIRFSVKEELPVMITIRDINGSLVTTITNRNYSPGVYRLPWTGNNYEGYKMTPGIYFVSMTTPYLTDTFKVVLLQ